MLDGPVVADIAVVGSDDDESVNPFDVCEKFRLKFIPSEFIAVPIILFCAVWNCDIILFKLDMKLLFPIPLEADWFKKFNTEKSALSAPEFKAPPGCPSAACAAIFSASVAAALFEGVWAG